MEAALDELPEQFQRPHRSKLASAAATRDAWLYGLYEGVPAIEWGADMVPFPNKIALFQLPLETDFPEPADLPEEVRVMVIHELAHHAGIDDNHLRELDYD